MEIGTQHKYAFNLLRLDFKPGEARCEEGGGRLQRRFGQEPSDAAMPRPGRPPLQYPVRADQDRSSPKLAVVITIRLIRFRQRYTDARALTKNSAFRRTLGYSADVGARHPGGRDGRLQRQDTIGSHRPSALVKACASFDRLRRRDFGHMDVEHDFGTIPAVYEAFSLKIPFDSSGEADIFESFCHENEKGQPPISDQK